MNKSITQATQNDKQISKSIKRFVVADKFVQTLYDIVGKFISFCLATSIMLLQSG